MEKVEEEPYKGIIKVWDIPRPSINTNSNYGWIQDRIRVFEKKNPGGVYIEFTPMDWHKFYNGFESEGSKDQRPDIIPIDPNFFRF